MSNIPLIRSGSNIVHGPQVDIFIVFDTTGSMNDKIEALINTCVQFVTQTGKRGLHVHYLLFSFGDLLVTGDKLKLEVPLTGNIQEIVQGLKNINRNAGGGNNGESSLEAVLEALKYPGRAESVKAMILITDEPAHQHDVSIHRVEKALQARNSLLYGLTPNISYYRELINNRGGQWQEISADSNLQMLESLFHHLAQNLATLAQQVHQISGGDVNAYLQLTSGKT